MIQQKENDWVLNLLNNQDFSVSDFKDVGLNADNTSLLSEDVYKQSKQIQDIFKKEDGTFDDVTFHKFYENAELMYNAMSNDTMMQSFNKQAAIYGKDNLFVSEDRRRSFDETVYYNRVPNPDRTTTGIIRVGQTTEPKLSQSELAQTQKVLANPTEVYDSAGNPDWSKAIWHDAPNDSWFTDFTDTRVLAQWESDGEHIDPITGETVKHAKGQLKLNEEGTYFYENLDGRDIYGKQVLNKMNTLTTDGSFWNKYDFFDSDDLEQKSIEGSLMKNAVLVGSMFIPYIGPWIAGLSVASQLVGLTGTLGKMLTGSDSPTFSAMEGWSKSVNRQTAKSQYAMENTWCWENFINLIGDVAGQLKEQRFLFEFAPAVIKGNKILGANGVSSAKKDALITKRMEELSKINKAKLDELSKIRPLTEGETQSWLTLQASNRLMAAKDIENFTKSYYKVGEILSKGYMTAITVGDTYGELKYEGKASDIEATLFTLGYAAAELALLNTDIGSWILPELKASGVKTKAMLQAIADVPDKFKRASASMSKETKKDFVKYWFQKGKETAESLYDGSSSLVGQAVAGALGEGVEETAEELLGDFAKQCYNTYQWLQGEDKKVSAWENMFDRYTMSLIGGSIGGGLTAVGTNFKTAFTPPKKEEAMQQLVYMLREGEGSNIRKAIEKIQFNNQNESFDVEQQSDGTFVNKAVTDKTKSKDGEIKQVLLQLVDNVESIINAEGLNISDQAFLDNNTFKEVRLSVLQQSPVTGLLLQEFNDLTSKIVSATQNINQLIASKKDGKEFTIEEQAVYDKETAELKALQEKKQAMLNGDLAMDYVSKSLFDLTKIISGTFGPAFFKDFVKQRYNRDVDTLDELSLKEYKEKYENWINTEAKNDISTNASLYLQLARNSREFIQDFAKNYSKMRKSKSIKDLINLKNDIDSQLDPDSMNQGQESEWFALFREAQTRETLSVLNILTRGKLEARAKEIFEGVNLGERYENILNDETIPEEEKKQALLDIKNETLENEFGKEILANLDNYLKDYINSGIINPEIKHSVQKALTDVKGWLNSLIGEDILQIPLNEYDDDSLLQEELSLMSARNIVKALNAIGKNVTEDDATIKDLKNLIEYQNDNISKIEEKQSELNNVSYTNIIDFIDKFIKSNSDTNLDVPHLFDIVNGLLNQNKDALDSIDLSQYTPQIKEALKVLDWLESLVLGAQTDSAANLTNLIGYNVTLNEIAKKHGKTWEALPEINVDDSNIIMQDLNLMRNKLKQVLQLYYVNSNQKESAIKNANTNLHLIHYKRLSRLIVNVDDSWAEKQKLVDALNNAKLLKTADLNNLTEEQRKQIIAESIVIDDAVYDFFQANNLTPEHVATLFRKDFDIYDDSSQLINAGTETLSDRNFFFYLSSRAALKRSNFIYEFRQVFNEEVAPFDIQEEAIYQTLADLSNRKTTNLFVDALRHAALQNWETYSDEQKLKIINRLKGDPSLVNNPNYLNLLDIVPKYTNIFLIEGLPGSGKTNASQYYVAKILEKFHKDLLNNVWSVHTSEKTAKDFSEQSLGIQSSKYLDKTKLMKLIYSKYKTDRKQDNNGAFIYESDEFNDDLLFNDVSDSMADPPSIIFIDEISHFTQPELELLDDFARKYKISIITSGDFDQSTTAAVVTKDNFPYQLINNHTLFKHSPKIGLSFRSNNAQLDKTISLFRSRLNPSQDIQFFYHENEELGLNGVKHLTDINQLEQSIEKLIKTLNPEQGNGKIGLIYYDEDSELVKLIDAKYADKFDKKKGTAAQGLEGQYYIIDTEGISLNVEQRNRDLYTSITRAQQGAIVYGYYPENISSIREKETYTSSKKNYSRLTKGKVELYNSLSLDSGIEFSGSAFKKPAKKEKTTSRIVVGNNTTVTNGTWTHPDQVEGFMYRGEKYVTDGVKVGKFISENEIELLADDDTIAKEILDIYNNYEPELDEDPPTEEELEDIQELIYPESFNQLFHSFNANQHSAISQKNPDGTANKKKPPVLVGGFNQRHGWRIDGFIGISKILGDWDINSGFKNGLTYEEYEAKFNGIQDVLLSLEGDAVHNHITEILGVDSVEDIEYGIFSSPNPSKGKKWGTQDDSGMVQVFDKHSDEYTEGIEYENLNRKTVGATIIVKKDGKLKRVYIPLFVLGNLRTWLVNPEKSSFGQILKQIDDDVNGNVYDFHVAVSESTNKDIPQHVKDLAKLFLFTQGGWFKFNEGWTPKSKLKNWGIQVNTEAHSGKKFPYNGAGTWTPIASQQKNGIRFSKEIYSANTDVEINGLLRPIAPRGHSFIFATRNPSLDSDEKMLEQYVKQLENPKEHKDVTLIYIATPRFTVEEYLTNLNQLFVDKTSAKRIGNQFTSFRIWESLIKQEVDLTSFNQVLKEDEINFIKEQISKLSALSDKNDQKNHLLTTVEFKGKKRCVRDHLNKLLRKTIVASTDKDKVDPDKVTAVAELIKSSGIEQIHYSHKFKESVSNSDIVSVMEQDYDNDGNPLYTIGGRAFTINAKLDSYLFEGDFNKELKGVRSKIIVNKKGILQSKDSDNFMRWPLTARTEAEDSTEEPTSKTVTKEMNGYKFDIVTYPDGKKEYYLNGTLLSSSITKAQVEYFMEYAPRIDTTTGNFVMRHPLLNLSYIPETLATNIIYDVEHNLEQWLKEGIAKRVTELCKVYNMQEDIDKFFGYEENGKIILGNLPKLDEAIAFSPSINAQLFSGVKHEIQIDLGDNRTLTIARRNDNTEITITRSVPDSGEEPSIELTPTLDGESREYTVQDIENLMKNPAEFNDFVNRVADERFKAFIESKGIPSGIPALIARYNMMMRKSGSAPIKLIEDIKKAIDENNKNACIYKI